jgi:DNA primase
MVILPDGHDPDSFVRKEGLGGIDAVMKEKKPLLDFFFEYNAKKHGLKTIETKIAFIRSILPYIEGMNDPVRRRLYTRRLSDLTGVEPDLILDRPGMIRNQEAGAGGLAKLRKTIEEKVVGVVINRPEFIEFFIGKEVEKHIADRNLRELFVRIIESYQARGSLDLKIFINELDRTELREKAASTAMDVADYDQHEMERIVSDYLCHVESNVIRGESKEITEKLAEAERRGDIEALRELLEKKKQVVAAMKYKSAK